MPSLSNAAFQGGTTTGSSRVPAIDVARGVAVLAMVVYHLAWDFSQLRLNATEIPAEPGWRLFSRAIAATFLLLVGVGLALAHPDRIRWRAFWRRLALVSGAALLITAATYFTYPDSYIFFGILHAIALSSLLAVPFTRTPAPAYSQARHAVMAFTPPLAAA